jgi:pyruvyltransferase
MNELEQVSRFVPRSMKLVSPFRYWKTTVRDILTSELVLSSSLHGIIVAEAFGVPVRFVMPSGGESLFKYEDYYAGTGRTLIEAPSGFNERISARSGRAMPGPVYSVGAMLQAFPVDLFEQAGKP